MMVNGHVRAVEPCSCTCGNDSDIESEEEEEQEQEKELELCASCQRKREELTHDLEMQEEELKAGRIPSLSRFMKGKQVEGNYRGKGKWLKCAITRVQRDTNGERRFDVLYDYGQFKDEWLHSETNIDVSQLRLLPEDAAEEAKQLAQQPQKHPSAMIISEEDKALLAKWDPRFADDEVRERDMSDLKALGLVIERASFSDQQSRGGTLLSEQDDDLYEAFVVSSYIKDADNGPAMARLMRLIKGLHERPDVTCVVNANGLVSIDLDAARQHLEAYFEHTCTLDLVASVNNKRSCWPFKFAASEGENVKKLNDLLASINSLAAFQDRFASLRCPLFSSKSAPGSHGGGCSGGGFDGGDGDDGEGEVPPTPPEPASISLEAYVANLRSQKDMREEALHDPHVYLREEILQFEALAEELHEEEERTDEVLGSSKGKKKRSFLLDNIQGLTVGVFKRVLRRAGVMLENDLIFESLRITSKFYLQELVRTTIEKLLRRRSKVVTVDDVLAARPLGVTLFGYGGPSAIRHVWSDTVNQVLKFVHPQMELDPKALATLNDIISYTMTSIVDKARELCMSSRRHEQERVDVEEDDDERAFFVKTFNANTDEGTPIPVLLYTGGKKDGEATKDDEQELEEPVLCMNQQDITSAVRIVFPRELRFHALQEGFKATRRCSWSGGKKLSACAGLKFNVEQLALIAGRHTNDFPLSVTAAVFLASVCEYITAEVLELSGNAANQNKSTFISCRHIMLAIRHDEELNAMLGKSVFREAGVPLNIPRDLAPHQDGANVEKAKKGQEKLTLTTFEKRLVQMGQAAQAGDGSTGFCFVDPRTGLHKGVFLQSPNVFESLPLLDALCKHTRAELMQLAQATLTEEDRALMLEEGYCVVDDKSERPAGLARESLSSIQKRRMSEIRDEQLSTKPFFARNVFSRLVREIARDFTSDLYFTAEAMEAIQAYLEAYLIDLCEEASRIASHARRSYLSVNDLSLARRVVHGGRR